MKRKLWDAVGALALATLAGLWIFALRDATSETPMPACAQAPADWQCWLPNGDVGEGELPEVRDSYWTEHLLPRRYAGAEAARRALRPVVRLAPPLARGPVPHLVRVPTRPLVR
jgi:hypothetical protein